MPDAAEPTADAGHLPMAVRWTCCRLLAPSLSAAEAAVLDCLAWHDGGGDDGCTLSIRRMLALTPVGNSRTLVAAPAALERRGLLRTRKRGRLGAARHVRFPLSVVASARRSVGKSANSQPDPALAEVPTGSVGRSANRNQEENLEGPPPPSSTTKPARETRRRGGGSSPDEQPWPQTVAQFVATHCADPHDAAQFAQFAHRMTHRTPQALAAAWQTYRRRQTATRSRPKRNPDDETRHLNSASHRPFPK